MSVVSGGAGQLQAAVIDGSQSLAAAVEERSPLTVPLCVINSSRVHMCIMVEVLRAGTHVSGTLMLKLSEPNWKTRM